VNGLIARDEETGEELEIAARIVVNATGVFTDEVRRMATCCGAPDGHQPGNSPGFDRSFLKGETALMVPRTAMGECCS